MLDGENIGAAPGVRWRRVLTDEELERRECVSVVSVHLARKPGEGRILMAQTQLARGIARNEVPEQKRLRLKW